MTVCEIREDYQRQHRNQSNNFERSVPSAYTNVIEDAGVATDVSHDDGINMIDAGVLPGAALCFDSTPPTSIQVPVQPCPSGTGRRFVLGERVCWTENAELELQAATYDCDIDAPRKTSGARFKQYPLEPMGNEHSKATGKPIADIQRNDDDDHSLLHVRNTGSDGGSDSTVTTVPWSQATEGHPSAGELPRASRWTSQFASSPPCLASGAL